MDTDGIMSTGIIYQYLSNFTSNLDLSFAQRSMGHGIENMIENYKNRGSDTDYKFKVKSVPKDTDLLIIVDSSSNSVDACKYLQENFSLDRQDIVIIDHHDVDVENPYALLVNCKLGDYPNRDLSGSAVVYKVCQVLDDYTGEDLADNYSDLVAIGLVGDMMNVANMENRFLINQGIREIKSAGVQQILKKSRTDFYRGISSTDISFKLSPIIGACSRLDQIELALELLTTDDEDRMGILAKEMIALNEQRKTSQKEIVESVVKNVDDSNNLIMLVDNTIDSGFRGLIATEVVARYGKPVFVLREIKDESGNIVKYGGSARGLGNIPFKDMCEESNLFTFATGHQLAFGIEFYAENMSKIYDYFNENLNAEDFERVIVYDLEVDASELEEIDLKEIEAFARIVGTGFQEPKFKLTGLTLEEGFTKKLGDHVRAVMGKNKDTVKIHCENNFALMKFRSNEEYAKELEDIFYDPFTTFVEVKAIGSLNLNVFYNFGTRETQITKQMFVEDYKYTVG